MSCETVRWDTCWTLCLSMQITYLNSVVMPDRNAPDSSDDDEDDEDEDQWSIDVPDLLTAGKVKFLAAGRKFIVEWGFGKALLYKGSVLVNLSNDLLLIFPSQPSSVGIPMTRGVYVQRTGRELVMLKRLGRVRLLSMARSSASDSRTLSTVEMKIGRDSSPPRFQGGKLWIQTCSNL